MKKRLIFQFLLLFPFALIGQSYQIEFSNDNACEGDVIRITAKGCDSKVLWQDGKVGKSILDTVGVSQSYSFTCRNSATNALLGSSLAIGLTAFPKPKTPFLLCDQDEIKKGKLAKISVFGCEGDVIWNNGATDKDLVVGPVETTTYTARCVNEFGCESDPISRTIIVIDKNLENGPVVTIKWACEGEDLLMKANGCTQGEYIWYKNDILENSGGILAEEVARGNDLKVVSGGENTYYTARCMMNQCLGNESNRLFVIFDDQLPSIKYPRRVYLDEGEEINLLSLLPKPSISTNTFEFRRTKSTNSPTVNDVSSVSESGTYYVRELTKDGNCASPIAKISVLKVNDEKRLLSSMNRDELRKPQTLELDAILEPEVEQNALLTLQNTVVGAVISSEKANDELVGVKIAQGFSPNGDGYNDTFEIENTTSQTIDLRVYNRFGHLVYEHKNYKNNWNGVANVGTLSNNNVGLPDDTYYYVVKLSDGRQKISFITLKR